MGVSVAGVHVGLGKPVLLPLRGDKASLSLLPPPTCVSLHLHTFHVHAEHPTSDACGQPVWEFSHARQFSATPGGSHQFRHYRVPQAEGSVPQGRSHPTPGASPEERVPRVSTLCPTRLRVRGSPTPSSGPTDLLEWLREHVLTFTSSWKDMGKDAEGQPEEMRRVRSGRSRAPRAVPVGLGWSPFLVWPCLLAWDFSDPVLLGFLQRLPRAALPGIHRISSPCVLSGGGGGGKAEYSKLLIRAWSLWWPAPPRSPLTVTS